MKLRFSVSSNLRCTTLNRNIPSHALYSSYSLSIRFCRTYHERRKLRMTPTLSSCQWSFYVLYTSLSTCSQRIILWILHKTTYITMISRSNHIYSNDGHSFYRIRTTLRTNVILRCNSYYKPSLCNTLCRWRHSTMSLRWFLS